LRTAFLFAAAASAALLSTACGTSDAVTNPAAPPLAGATWRLASIQGRPALAGVRVTAVFADESRVSGTAGCNSYTGSARVTADRIEVGGVASTRMYCSATGVMEQEDAYFDAFAKATSYRIAGNRLELGPAPGTVTLVYDLE
jgi:heat shock protein HslJ